MECKTTRQDTMEICGGGIAGNGAIVRPSLLPSKQASEKMEFMKGGCRFTPPPFLTKTFQMVEDTETNNMISWNSDGTSLIVWDHLKLAAEVLPKYFSHNNISSFIYQLNNYGFKKIGPRQYEYENKWFQRGQKHLLMNIRRRYDADPTIRKRRGPRKQHVMAARPSVEAKQEIFEDHMNALKEEITRSNYLMGKLESSIATFKQNVKRMEAKSKALIKILARKFGPAIVEKIIQRVEEELELEALQTMKRRRVILPQSSKTTTKSTNDGACGMDQDDQEANTSMAESKQSIGQKLWKKFMGDDSVSEDESEKQLLKQHVYEAELEIFEDHMNALKQDITRSKYRMGKLESSIATFKKKAKRMEAKSKALIKVLARKFGPAVVEKIIQRVEEELELEALQTMKRRRVILPQSSKTKTKSTNDGACGMDQDDQEANTSMAESKQSADQKLWKKFMEDDSVSEDESEQQLLKQHWRIDMASDDLMVSKTMNANEPNLDVGDEVAIDLSTVSLGAASRRGDKTAARRVDASEFSASFGYFYL